ncbi:hypothetical protein Peur_011423 [Populus x canadensis]
MDSPPSTGAATSPASHPPAAGREQLPHFVHRFQLQQPIKQLKYLLEKNKNLVNDRSLVVFFCFGKGEFVVGGATDGDKEELSVKALLEVVADGVRANGNYGFGGF